MAIRSSRHSAMNVSPSRTRCLCATSWQPSKLFARPTNKREGTFLRTSAGRNSLIFLQISFLLKIARRIPPYDQKLSGENIRFDELDIARGLSAYCPQLSDLAALFLPDQDIGNWIQKEIAVAASEDPPYVPYLTPKLCETPRIPLDTGRKTARTRWMGFSKQARRSLIPQELSIRAFSRYRLRFVVSAALCSAWRSFGGLCPQLYHFPTVLHISITESVGAAISYHRMANLKLQEKARKRSIQASEFTSIIAAGNFPIKEQAEKEVPMAIETDLCTRDRTVKGKGKEKRRFNNAASNADSSRNGQN